MDLEAHVHVSNFGEFGRKVEPSFGVSDLRFVWLWSKMEVLRNSNSSCSNQSWERAFLLKERLVFIGMNHGYHNTNFENKMIFFWGGGVTNNFEWLGLVCGLSNLSCCFGLDCFQQDLVCGINRLHRCTYNCTGFQVKGIYHNLVLSKRPPT